MKKSLLIFILILLSSPIYAQTKVGSILDYDGESFFIARRGDMQEHTLNTDIYGFEIYEGDFISTEAASSLVIQLEGKNKVIHVYENTSLTFFFNPQEKKASFDMLYGKVDMEINESESTEIGDYNIASSGGPSTVEYKIIMDSETKDTKEDIQAKKGNVEIKSSKDIEQKELSAKNETNGAKEESETKKSESLSSEKTAAELHPDDGIKNADRSSNNKFHFNTGGDIVTYIPDLGDGMANVIASILFLYSGPVIQVAYNPVEYIGIGFETGFLTRVVSFETDSENKFKYFYAPIVLTIPLKFGPLFLQPAGGIDVFGTPENENYQFYLTGTAYAKAGLQFSLFTIYASYGMDFNFNNFKQTITRVGAGVTLPIDNIWKKIKLSKN